MIRHKIIVLARYGGNERTIHDSNIGLRGEGVRYFGRVEKYGSEVVNNDYTFVDYDVEVFIDGIVIVWW